MLYWRILLGISIIVALVGLCWLDHLTATPGVWLLPVAIVFATMASGEIIRLAELGQMRPLLWAVYAGNLLLVLSNWVPVICRGDGQEAPRVDAAAWPLFAMAASVLLVFIGEMRRYEKPGGTMRNVAAAMLGLVYVGLLLSFAIQLRMTWGIGALASLLVVVKLGDTGAYTFGRLIGRHKITPVLSPGKTFEGAVGALTFSCIGSWAVFRWLVPALAPHGGQTAWWGWLLFGLSLAVAGIVGDLCESLLKRDAGCKDSSSWLPGFGGILDILDSILVAAPIAWLFWALGLVGS